MNKLASVSLGIFIALSAMVATVQTAEAGPCTGGCEQYRRTCLFETKFIFDAAKKVCLEDWAVCRQDCKDDPTLTNREEKVCQRSCRSTSLQCRGQVRAEHFDRRDQCDVLDENCIATCEEVEDRICRRSCSKSVKSCYKAAKEVKESCFHQCRLNPVPNCKPGCREVTIAAHDVCTADFFDCLAGGCVE